MVLFVYLPLRLSLGNDFPFRGLLLYMAEAARSWGVLITPAVVVAVVAAAAAIAMVTAMQDPGRCRGPLRLVGRG